MKTNRFNYTVEIVNSPDTYCIKVEVPYESLKALNAVRKYLWMPNDACADTKAHFGSKDEYTISYLTLGELRAIILFLNQSSELYKNLNKVQEILIDELAKRNYLSGNEGETKEDRERIRVTYGELKE